MPTVNPTVDAQRTFFLRNRQGPMAEIDDADTRLLGSSDPSLMAGITNIITYKNFQPQFRFQCIVLAADLQIPIIQLTASVPTVFIPMDYNALRSVKKQVGHQTIRLPHSQVPSGVFSTLQCRPISLCRMPGL